MNPWLSLSITIAVTALVFAFCIILLAGCTSLREFHEKYKDDPRLWEISRQLQLSNPKTEVCTYGVAGRVCVK